MTEGSVSFLFLFFVVSCPSLISESSVPLVSCLEWRTVRLLKYLLPSSTPFASTPYVELSLPYLVSVYPIHLDDPNVEVFVPNIGL